MTAPADHGWAASPAPVDLVIARKMLDTRPGEHERAGWAETWGTALLDEVSRLRLALDRAERGSAYWERCAKTRDTKTYRALVERTAERDALTHRAEGARP